MKHMGRQIEYVSCALCNDCFETKEENGLKMVCDMGDLGVQTPREFFH